MGEMYKYIPGPRINNEEIESINLIPSRIISKFKELEENFIKEVLRQLLKREPTIEDAKKTCIFYNGIDLDRYELSYEGVKLGIVKFKNQSIPLNEPYGPPSFSIEFIPHKIFNGETK